MSLGDKYLALLEEEKKKKKKQSEQPSKPSKSSKSVTIPVSSESPSLGERYLSLMEEDGSPVPQQTNPFSLEARSLPKLSKEEKEEIESLREQKRKEYKAYNDSKSKTFRTGHLNLQNPDYGTSNKNEDEEDNVAPVKDERTWFDTSVFDDGYQFGDVVKAILGTGTDVATNASAGVIGMGEKSVDAFAMLGAANTRQQMMENAAYQTMYNRLTGNEEDASETLNKYLGVQSEIEKGTSEFVAKDLYDEKAVAKSIISDPVKNLTGIDSEKDSLLGDKSDDLVYSGGELLGRIAVDSVLPGSGMVLTGVTTFGGEAENALKNGATFSEAGFSASVSTAGELLTEYIGGVKFGGKTLTDAAFDALGSKLTGKTAQVLLKTGKIAVDSASEGVEEIISGYVSAAGQKMSYMEDSEIEELFSDDDKLESFIGGLVLGGTFSVGESLISGRDTLTGMTKSEQTVIDKEVENRVAEKEKNGTELSKKEVAKIKEQVREDLEKGYISIDTIESTLGGDAYKSYKDTVDSEEALKTELETLSNIETGKLTRNQQKRLEELEGMNLSDTTKRDGLRKELDDTLSPLLKDSKLQESYNERDRRGQALEVDLNQYKGKQREAVERAVKSGVLNNTNRSRDLVNVLSKIEADKGIAFDYTDNAKLKESGFAVDGKTVNGYVQNGNVTLNVQSAKAWQSVVGHEVTHILEGTESYGELQSALYAYAESRGELESRKTALTELYKGMDANIDSELTADLVGDYLFNDPKFISNLTGNRNVFQKVYDEIKYLWNVATGKEKTQIEKVKREFEKAWDELALKESLENEATDTEIDDVEYSVSVTDEKTLDSLNEQVARGEYDAETNPDGGYYVTYKSMSFWGYDDEGNAILRSPMAEYVDGELSNAYLIPKDKSKLNWYQATETIDENTGLPSGLMVKTKKAGNKSFSYLPAAENQDLIKEDWSNLYFNLQKKVLKNGKWVKSDVPARYNPYEHSSNSMLNDQFSAAHLRDNLVTVKMYVPVSEDNGAFRAKWSKDPTGWADWKTGTVAGKINKQKDLQRKVYLSRYAAPVEIVSDAEVAQAYKSYIEGTDVAIPDNVVSPNLLKELKKAGVPITESGKVKYSVSEDSNGNELSLAVQRRFANTKAVDENGRLKVLYHGTYNGEFYTFDKAKGSVEGDFGSGFYFTDSEYDMETNYEGGGADFNNKVDMRAAQIEAEEDIDYFEAEERAKKELYKGSNRFEVYLNIENPAIVGETRLLDPEKYFGEYNRNDYDSEEDYDADVEQLIADDIDQILWDIDRNVDVYKTDGIAEVLWNAVNEGGIDIEQLKKNINALYLEDSNGNIVGNEVARQIIESLGYDGIIDPTVSSKFNMDMDYGTTHYIVFKPNQIKDINNQNPTDNPDIRKSLSDEGEQPSTVGTPLKDLYYEQGKDTNVPTAEAVGEEAATDIAPVFQKETPRAKKDPLAKPKSAQIADGTRGDNLLYESLDNYPMKTVEQQVAEKIRALEGELADNQDLRREAESNYNAQIAKLRAEYNAKKNKNTKVANGLLQSISRLERLKASTDANFAKRIGDLEARLEKMRDPKYSRALQGSPKTRKQLHNNIINDIKATFSSGGFGFDDVLEKAKNLSTLSTVDNTPQRVMEKALGYKEGQILSDLTVNKVAQNETEGIKWLNSFTDRKNGLLAQISKQYKIKPASKESAAAQMYAEGFYVTEDNEIVAYGDAELAQDFPDANVRNNIKGLARDPRIRQIYDETLAAINKSRARNAYPEIQRLDNYFLHFRAMEDTFSRLGLPFNPSDIRAKDLPTDLNGVTADLKPGQPYFASANHRKGKRTSFDLLGGLERYLTSAKNQIYHIDDIQTLRALRNYIADNYGQANGLEGLDMLTEEEAQERVEQVYSSHLSTFAKFLNEEANVLAGKTALIDRGLEGIIGRRGMTFLDTVNRQVGSNMVGFNISSSLTNFIPVAQTFAKTNKFDFLKAFTQTVSNRFGSVFGKSDGFAENSPVVIRRKGADRFYRTPFQKVGDAGYVLMSAVDNISTELIARTKFNELTRKGMSEQQAHFETDKWVSRLMGDRSLGQMPQLYNSKTLGVLTKFQLEVRNQLDSQFYDTIQEAKVSNEEIENRLARNAKTAAKITSTFVQLAVAQHLFGKAFESVAGYNPAFDIISVLATMFGFDDDEESEDTALDNIEQGFFELLEDLPYTSTLTGGRIPISSALPVTELIKGVDSYGNEKSRLETLSEAAPYYILPSGYGQIKKTTQGLNMFSDEHPVSGSYTDSGNLRFPVEDTPENRLQAAVFGQYASENAREYFDNGYAPLKEKQIQEYVDVELPIADYWKYREGLTGLKTAAEKADYINSLDIENWQKNLLMNNILDRKEDVDMSNYDDYSDFEEFDFAEKNPEKYEFFKENGISYKDYESASEDGKRAYTWAYENPEKYAVSKLVSDDVVTYRSYTSDLYDIRADKDENGETIVGTGKDKKIDYINGLDLEYGQKIILFKMQYKADDTYNEDIVDYVNNRSDLTYEERVTILTELGFTVQGDTVYWD